MVIIIHYCYAYLPESELQVNVVGSRTRWMNVFSDRTIYSVNFGMIMNSAYSIRCRKSSGMESCLLVVDSDVILC